MTSVGSDSPTGGGESSSGTDDSVELDLLALVRHIRPVLMGLKQGGPPPAIFRAAFEQNALGPRHAPVLMAVALEGRLSVSDLADRLRLSLSTTSLLVGELSRAGLLDRAEDQSDRRRTIVELSPRYREPAERWLSERLAPLRRTLMRLPARARANFLEGWRILEEEASRVGADEQ